MVTLTDILAAMNLIYQDDFANAIRNDVLLPNILGVRPASGRNATCAWTAKFSGRGTARVDDGTDVSAPDFVGKNVKKQASLPWGRYSAFGQVDGLAAALASANGRGSVGRNLDVDLLMEEAQDAVDEKSLLLSQDCYTGDPSLGELSGADTMALGNTYAGIDKTTLADPTEWAIGAGTASKASLQISDLRAQLHRPFFDATGSFPDFVTCDGASFDLIGALFEGDIRYVDEIQTAGGGVMSLKRRAGYRAIEVDGVIYIEDRHATADTLYAWSIKNTAFIQVDPYHSSMVSAVRVNAALASLGITGVTDDDVAERMKIGRSRLQPTMMALAKNGDNERFMTKVYCQLRHKNRKWHAQMALTI